MRNPIGFLKWAGLIHPPGSRCLDVGAHDGTFSRLLAEQGYNVLAIDKNQMPTIPAKVTFLQVSIEEFEAPQPYDLIFARHILPFTGDPIRVFLRLVRFLDEGGVCVATFLGKGDQYCISGGATPVNYEKVLDAIDSTGVQIYHSSTVIECGPDLNGNGYKWWHLYNFVVRQPQS